MLNQKSFFRSLNRNRIHTAITLIGFSLSMAVVIILAAYIKSEKSINRQYPNVENIYLINKNNQSAYMPESILEKLKKDIPGIEDATMWNSTKGEFGDNSIEGKVMSVDKSFLNIFSITPLKGDTKAIDIENTVFLTSGFAKKLFGKEYLKSENTSFYKSVPLQIAGLISDNSKQSGFDYDLLITRNNRWGSNSHCNMNGCEFLYASAILLNNKVEKDSIQSKINNLISKYELFRDSEITLVPFRDVYFESSIKDDFMRHANSAMIRLLIYVTLAILILAMLNYINLTTARGLSRLKEVGIKKTLGAGRLLIFKQFLSETYQLVLYSIILALGISILSKPLFEKILEKEINLNILTNDGTSIIIAVVLIIVFGFISGIIPAISASRFTPISLMNSLKTGTKGYTVRSFMNVLQFAISIVLIISQLMVFRQIDYVKNKDLGFNKEQLMRLDLSGLPFSKAKAFKETLLSNTNITNASLTNGGPGNITSSASFHYDSLNLEEVGYITVDTDFLKTFNIPLLKGVNITSNEKDGFVINETFYKALGEKDLINLHLNNDKYIGVIGDFHCRDLHQTVYPICIKPLGENNSPSLLNIRLKTENIGETMSFIEKTNKEFQSGQTFRYKFYDEWFDSMYQQEENQAAAIRIFTILAILISCLGLFGLAEFQTRKKIKEIGIRRVNGAKVSEILFMLNKDFIKPIIIAFIIACPVGYYLMNKWLANFAYKAAISWWIFAISGMLALAIAIITVSWHSWKAATRNPVESLRSE